MADNPDDTVGPWVFTGYDKSATVTLFKGIRDRLQGSAEVSTTPGVQVHRVHPSPFEMLRPSEKPWSQERAQSELSMTAEVKHFLGFVDNSQRGVVI